MNDLLDKTIDLLSNSASIVGPQIRAGKVKAIGITGKQRVTNLPDIPTLDEQGLKGFDMVVFAAIFAPKGLPKPVHHRLAAGLQAVIDDAEKKAHVGRTDGILRRANRSAPPACRR